MQNDVELKINKMHSTIEVTIYSCQKTHGEEKIGQRKAEGKI